MKNIVLFHYSSLSLSLELVRLFFFEIRFPETQIPCFVLFFKVQRRIQKESDELPKKNY